MLMVLVFSVVSYGQSPKDVPKEYRSEWRQDFNDAKKYLRKEAKDWDINLPLEEKVGIPTVADFTNWGVEQLRPDAIYNELYSRCTYRVRVKIFDTSQQYYHDDLVLASVPGSNYAGDNTPQIDQGHGIHVGGIVAGKEGGITYPCVKKGLVKIKPVQVLNDNGSGSFNWVKTGIETEDIENAQLINDGVAVVSNYSLGGGTSLISSVEAAFKASNELGVIHVAANGNTRGAVNYPGKSQYTFGVSSLDKNLRISSFSSRGPETDYTAPGRAINSTYKNNSYASLSGTSMATPFVTGLIAIAQSVYGLDKLPNQAAVEKYFDWIATDLGDTGQDDLYGMGLTYVKAILDNNPSDNPNNDNPPPPPPSCNDGKQNGEETGVDCGGDCPPCEVDEPDNPGEVFPERVITVVLEGKWPLLWVEAGSTSDVSFEGLLFENGSLYGLDWNGNKVLTFTAFEMAALDAKYGWLDYTKLTIRVKTTKSAHEVYQDVKEAIDNTWNGRRGVGIAAPADDDGGATAGAYFTDLLLDRYPEGKLDITVDNIVYDNRKGSVFTKYSDEMPQWPRGSDPFDVPFDFSIELGTDGVYRYHDNKKDKSGDIKATYTIVAEWGKWELTKTDQPGFPSIDVRYFDSKGIYEYNIQSVGYPDIERIKKDPPYQKDDWELIEVLSVERTPRK